MIVCVCSAGVGRAGRVALVSCGAGGGHTGPGEARGDADADGETRGGPAAPLPAGQAGGAEDHPHQQGQKAPPSVLLSNSAAYDP